MSDILNDVFLKLKQFEYMKNELREPFNYVSEKYLHHAENLFKLAGHENYQKANVYLNGFKSELENGQTALRRIIYSKIFNSEYQISQGLNVVYLNDNDSFSKEIGIAEDFNNECKLVLPLINGFDILIPFGEKYKCLDIILSGMSFLSGVYQNELMIKEDVSIDLLSFNNASIFHDRIYHLAEDSFLHIKISDNGFNSKMDVIQIIYRMILKR